MDELRALRYLTKVVETGNFTKAASLFSVPPSSLSRGVAIHLPHPLAPHHHHRVRQVRRVDLQFLPRGYSPLSDNNSSYTLPEEFLEIRLRRT
jgi:hypothetical protein